MPLRHSILTQTVLVITDTDDDGDGVADGSDAFHLMPPRRVTDSDGIGNNADTDDDGDGVAMSDAFPLDTTETLDMTRTALVITPILMTMVMVLPIPQTPFR